MTSEFPPGYHLNRKSNLHTPHSCSDSSSSVLRGVSALTWSRLPLPASPTLPSCALHAFQVVAQPCQVGREKKVSNSQALSLQCHPIHTRQCCLPLRCPAPSHLPDQPGMPGPPPFPLTCTKEQGTHSCLFRLGNPRPGGTRVRCDSCRTAIMGDGRAVESRSGELGHSVVWGLGPRFLLRARCPVTLPGIPVRVGASAWSARESFQKPPLRFRAHLPQEPSWFRAVWTWPSY